MHRRFEDSAVTEDDINEVKSDISAMRYEMLEVFEKNGMDISSADKKEKAHLAKRMKVWERRLMKDFQVAPVQGEEEEEPLVEKGIARFRRIAQQVAHQTTSHKWHEAVRGVTDTQIGRCRNRESFRNQQNLQRAMEEAKRLVSRSPAASRTCTPVEFYDPTTNTLLELLKNISEEVGELSPQSTVRTIGSHDRSAQLTSQLQELFVNKSPSPLPPNVLQKIEAATVMQVKELERKKRQSISSNLSQQSNDEADGKHRPKSPSAASIQSSKSPEPTPRKSITSIASRGSSGEEMSASMQPPLIQITRTESSKSIERPKIVKSNGNHSEIARANASSPVNMRPTSPTPTQTGPAKVVKRKAPSPSASSEAVTDIAISRPVPMKVDSRQGMIPPPPPIEKKDTTSSNSAETSFTMPPRRVSLTPKPPSPVLPSPVHMRKQSIAPIPTQQSMQCVPAPTVAMGIESPTTDSSENLLQIKGSPQRASGMESPLATLRPQRKVTEVTTIKRQPKTGWL